MACSALQLISTQRATAGIERRLRPPRRYEQQLRHAEAIADACDARRICRVRAVLKHHEQVATPSGHQAVDLAAEARVVGEGARLSREDRRGREGAAASHAALAALCFGAVTQLCDVLQCAVALCFGATARANHTVETATLRVCCNMSRLVLAVKNKGWYCALWHRCARQLRRLAACKTLAI